MVRLVLFYGISTIVGYLIPNLFLYIKTVPFRIIQFSIRLVFGSHIVKCQNRSVECQNSSILNNSVEHKHTVSMSKNGSISNNSV